mgnify:FL=1
MSFFNAGFIKTFWFCSVVCMSFVKKNCKELHWLDKIMGGGRLKQFFKRSFFMKKLFGLLAVAGFAVTSAFANVEMDLNMYGTPFSEYEIENDVKLRQGNPVGFESQFGFYFGSPVKWLDIGMSLSDGIDVGASGVEIGINDNFSKPDDSIVFDFFFTLGPAVRFNLGKMHSLYFSPGFGYNISVLGYNIKYDEYGYNDEKSFSGGFSSFDFNLDLGYRVWIVNKTGFHFGFDVGYDLSVPLETSSFGDFEEADVLGGQRHKIYFGVAFNFGDKSPDKFAEQSE